MKVLVVHNRYRSALPSGENRVVDDEVAMLREAGVEVDTYIRDSDEIEGFGPFQKAGLAVRPLYSPEDVRRFRQRLERFRPNVVHLHNPFPLISPAVVRVAKRAGVPVVQTVHNYRHVCAKATFFRDGGICQDCSGKAFPWPAVVHRCYRGSRSQSAVMATALAVHRSTWQLVDRFLAVSEFVADHLRKSGVSPGRIVLRPNAVADPGVSKSTGEGFLFAGRLDPEKGVRLLLEAWEISGLGPTSKLVIAGDGPDRPFVEDAARRLPGVHFLGLVRQSEIARLLTSAAVVVVPSTCFEGLPRIVVEAFSHGLPVLACGTGSLSPIVGPRLGWISHPTPSLLGQALKECSEHPDEVRSRGSAARRFYMSHYSPLALTSLLCSEFGRLSPAAPHSEATQ